MTFVSMNALNVASRLDQLACVEAHHPRRHCASQQEREPIPRGRGSQACAPGPLGLPSTRNTTSSPSRIPSASRTAFGTVTCPFDVIFAAASNPPIPYLPIAVRILLGGGTRAAPTRVTALQGQPSMMPSVGNRNSVLASRSPSGDHRLIPSYHD